MSVITIQCIVGPYAIQNARAQDFKHTVKTEKKVEQDKNESSSPKELSNPSVKNNVYIEGREVWAQIIDQFVVAARTFLDYHIGENIQRGYLYEKGISIETFRSEVVDRLTQISEMKNIKRARNQLRSFLDLSPYGELFQIFRPEPIKVWNSNELHSKPIAYIAYDEQAYMCAQYLSLLDEQKYTSRNFVPNLPLEIGHYHDTKYSRYEPITSGKHFVEYVSGCLLKATQQALDRYPVLVGVAYTPFLEISLMMRAMREKSFVSIDTGFPVDPSEVSEWIDFAKGQTLPWKFEYPEKKTSEHYGCYILSKMREWHQHKEFDAPYANELLARPDESYKVRTLSEKDISIQNSISAIEDKIKKSVKEIQSLGLDRFDQIQTPEQKQAALNVLIEKLTQYGDFAAEIEMASASLDQSYNDAPTSKTVVNLDANDPRFHGTHCPESSDNPDVMAWNAIDETRAFVSAAGQTALMLSPLASVAQGLRVSGISPILKLNKHYFNLVIYGFLSMILEDQGDMFKEGFWIGFFSSLGIKIVSMTEAVLARVIFVFFTVLAMFMMARHTRQVKNLMKEHKYMELGQEMYSFFMGTSGSILGGLTLGILWSMGINAVGIDPQPLTPNGKLPRGVGGANEFPAHDYQGVTRHNNFIQLDPNRLQVSGGSMNGGIRNLYSGQEVPNLEPGLQIRPMYQGSNPLRIDSYLEPWNKPIIGQAGAVRPLYPQLVPNSPDPNAYPFPSIVFSDEERPRPRPDRNYDQESETSLASQREILRCRNSNQRLGEKHIEMAKSVLGTRSTSNKAKLARWLAYQFLFRCGYWDEFLRSLDPGQVEALQEEFSEMEKKIRERLSTEPIVDPNAPVYGSENPSFIEGYGNFLPVFAMIDVDDQEEKFAVEEEEEIIYEFIDEIKNRIKVEALVEDILLFNGIRSLRIPIEEKKKIARVLAEIFIYHYRNGQDRRRTLPSTIPEEILIPDEINMRELREHLSLENYQTLRSRILWLFLVEHAYELTESLEGSGRYAPLEQAVYSMIEEREYGPHLLRRILTLAYSFDAIGRSARKVLFDMHELDASTYLIQSVDFRNFYQFSFEASGTQEEMLFSIRHAWEVFCLMIMNVGGGEVVPNQSFAFERFEDWTRAYEFLKALVDKPRSTFSGLQDIGEHLIRSFQVIIHFESFELLLTGVRMLAGVDLESILRDQSYERVDGVHASSLQQNQYTMRPWEGVADAMDQYRIDVVEFSSHYSHDRNFYVDLLRTLLQEKMMAIWHGNRIFIARDPLAKSLMEIALNLWKLRMAQDMAAQGIQRPYHFLSYNSPPHLPGQYFVFLPQDRRREVLPLVNQAFSQHRFQQTMTYSARNTGQSQSGFWIETWGLVPFEEYYPEAVTFRNQGESSMEAEGFDMSPSRNQLPHTIRRYIREHLHFPSDQLSDPFRIELSQDRVLVEVASEQNENADYTTWLIPIMKILRSFGFEAEPDGYVTVDQQRYYRISLGQRASGAMSIPNPMEVYSPEALEEEWQGQVSVRSRDPREAPEELTEDSERYYDYQRPEASESMRIVLNPNIYSLALHWMALNQESQGEGSFSSVDQLSIRLRDIAFFVQELLRLLEQHGLELVDVQDGEILTNRFDRRLIGFARGLLLAFLDTLNQSPETQSAMERFAEVERRRADGDLSGDDEEYMDALTVVLTYFDGQMETLVGNLRERNLIFREEGGEELQVTSEPFQNWLEDVLRLIVHVEEDAVDPEEVEPDPLHPQTTEPEETEPEIEEEVDPTDQRDPRERINVVGFTEEDLEYLQDKDQLYVGELKDSDWVVAHHGAILEIHSTQYQQNFETLQPGDTYTHPMHEQLRKIIRNVDGHRFPNPSADVIMEGLDQREVVAYLIAMLGESSSQYIPFICYQILFQLSIPESGLDQEHLSSVQEALDSYDRSRITRLHSQIKHMARVSSIFDRLQLSVALSIDDADLSEQSDFALSANDLESLQFLQRSHRTNIYISYMSRMFLQTWKEYDFNDEDMRSKAAMMGFFLSLYHLRHAYAVKILNQFSHAWNDDFSGIIANHVNLQQGPERVDEMSHVAELTQWNPEELASLLYRRDYADRLIVEGFSYADLLNLYEYYKKARDRSIDMNRIYTNSNQQRQNQLQQERNRVSEIAYEFLISFGYRVLLAFTYGVNRDRNDYRNYHPFNGRRITRTDIDHMLEASALVSSTPSVSLFISKIMWRLLHDDPAIEDEEQTELEFLDYEIESSE